MSTTVPKPATRSRWMDWKPKVRILAGENEPTKPSKPGFVGFDGATPAESPEIEAGQDPAELAQASGVLGRAGVRLMELDGGVPTVGVWSDRDGPDVRAALKTMESDSVPVRYLDGDGIPSRYKVRAVDGELIPLSVLWAMDRHPEEPWKVRDRMLKELGWHARGIVWAGRAGQASKRNPCDMGTTLRR